VRRESIEQQPPAFSASVQQDRLGGWLWLFVVSQIIICGLQLSYVVELPASFTPEGRNLQRAVPAYFALALFEAASVIVKAVMAIAGVVLIFRRSRRTPFFVRGFLGFLIVDGVIRMSALRLMYPAIEAAFQQAGDSLVPLAAALDYQFSSGLREVGYAGVWLVYWWRSTRVSRLFTRAEVAGREELEST
jgi:Protein of unknown function (DUF2569)